ncbi:uncharacterized protein DSM5745_05742 [Aspergillus mulundensis]|uniref:Poly [ADP-ribose] polymerase n=1 Tax=Aspergillus mulundensis TaxID=1810919 RepID=A0A3D8RYF3_9EURO|nr:hypothetical protein DSM5745_05742 [Aspergillus mulundensis]RDW78890.1 hypothetical protein DSM5745_05742 [Aspergillus mulundensis]
MPRVKQILRLKQQKRKEAGERNPTSIAGIKRLLETEGSNAEDEARKKMRMDIDTELQSMILPAHKHCPFKYEYSIYIDSYGHPWVATLRRSAAGTVENEYHHLQLLKHKSGTSFVAWAGWGKIGKGPVIQSKPTPTADLTQARADFESQFMQHTGYAWASRFDNPPQRAGKFVYRPPGYLSRDCEHDPFNLQKAPKVITHFPVPECGLPEATREIVAYILNQDTLLSDTTGYDASKLPLGQLDNKTLVHAYHLLEKLLELILNPGSAQGATSTHLANLSSQYFSLIPHIFGDNQIPVISTANHVDEELKLLNELANGLLATRVGSDSKSDFVSPVERALEKLNLHNGGIIPLDHKVSEFKRLKTYYERTSNPTDAANPYKVIQIFRITRPGEEARFQTSKFAKLGPKHSDRRLLWHGSKRINFAGIFKAGLLIQPNGVKLSGSMLGHGVYFSDMAGKSLNYACGMRTQKTGLLLLCDVEMGQRADGTCRHHCHGQRPVSNFKDASYIHSGLRGLKVVDVAGKKDVFGQMSEYVVYDEAQIRIRYLVFVAQDRPGVG